MSPHVIVVLQSPQATRKPWLWYQRRVTWRNRYCILLTPFNQVTNLFVTALDGYGAFDKRSLFDWIEVDFLLLVVGYQRYGECHEWYLHSFLLAIETKAELESSFNFLDLWSQ